MKKIIEECDMRFDGEPPERDEPKGPLFVSIRERMEFREDLVRMLGLAPRKSDKIPWGQ